MVEAAVQIRAITRLARVLFEYLGGGHTQESPNRDDRGMGGAQVDIVDALHGVTCLGFTDQSETEELLEDVMAFDYDFAKEGTSCAL